MMELVHDTHVWFAFSFALFVIVAWRFGRSAMIGNLDRRIALIRKEIEAAAALRAEAQTLLEEYQRKQKDALKDAENIIRAAREQAQDHRRQAGQDLEETMKRREKQLEDRLSRMEQNAIQEIRQYAAELAMDATARVIAEKLDTKNHERLVDQSIKNISENIQ